MLFWGKAINLWGYWRKSIKEHSNKERNGWQYQDLTLSQTSPGFYLSAVQVF